MWPFRPAEPAAPPRGPLGVIIDTAHTELVRVVRAEFDRALLRGLGVLAAFLAAVAVLGAALWQLLDHAAGGPL